MIGTNSIEESSEEILYPSITVCSRAKEYTPNLSNSLLAMGYTNDTSAFHQSQNLSEMVLWLSLWQRNDTGNLEMIGINPTDGKFENRDKNVM